MAIKIEENKPLKELTTFKIGGPADYFCTVSDLEELKESVAFAREKQRPIFVLGGGSNMLVSDAGLRSLVLHLNNKGISVLDEDDAFAYIKINAGEVWDGVVGLASKNNWWGIENLSHIPGTAGGAIVQNVGAYGQQLSNVLTGCEALNLATGEIKEFKPGEFEFDYRKSVFNTSRKGEFAVLSITVKLSKIPPVVIDGKHPNLKYPDVAKYFEEKGVAEPSISQIREAIISIRDSKYPFPKEEVGGNAGSFFKNLLLSDEDYAELEKKISENFSGEEAARLKEIKDKFTKAPSTTRKSGQIKIPTAFLIDICGLKGFQAGGIKVNEKQPLVLLNTGGATANDALAVIKHVRKTLFEMTGMKIETEPELVGFTGKELEEAFAV